MATPPTIPVEDLLLPIDGDDPSGRSLAYEPEYDALREARRSEDATHQGDWVRDAKSADWPKVVALAGDCLRTRSKDLQIAAWLTEALTHRHGFAGLRDGFTLLHGMQERFWDTYYPKIEDGEIDSRFAPFIFLNDARVLPLLIRRVPVTRGLSAEPYPFFRYHESRETDNLILKTPDKSKAILAEGRITGKAFDDQVSQTPRAFYETLSDDLAGAYAAFKAFETGTDARFGADSPSLTNVGKALVECRQWLDPVLADKRLKEPDPVPEPEPQPEPPDSPGPAPVPDGEKPAAGSNGAAATPSLDFGRVLIEFRTLAQGLAEAGAKLEENRKKYGELQAELKKLDDEYAAIAREVGRDGLSRQLLKKILDAPARG